MTLLTKAWQWLRSFALSLVKRSFKTHDSVYASDAKTSLAFYQQLGFKAVVSSRGGEVVLLRNHRGDELNLVARANGKASSQMQKHLLFEVSNLQTEINQIQAWCSNYEITEDAISKRITLPDPDGNIVELSERLPQHEQAQRRLYHIATRSELTAGLSEHFYMPPDAAQRFVRARARSAFMSLACQRVAQEAHSSPLIIELDIGQLSVEEPLADDQDMNSDYPADQSSYPHVNAPIPRLAIVAVGECVEASGDFPWPGEFLPLRTAIGHQPPAG